ncbi:MAG: DUF2202 domain-containing protein [Planctomycetes bacterium]|nr:DUF2202 domain-containing protein [Planctomycetota bacterium]
MKKNSLVLTVLFVGLVAISLPASAQRGRGSRGGRGRGLQQRRANLVTVDLTVEIRESLLHMREEEKLARDVYLTLSKKHNSAVFSQIASAESRHMAALERLLDRYGLPDPVVDDAIGKFTKPEFTQLYNKLISQGGKSLVDAYEVGALIEELDIADLISGVKMLEANTDIERIYQNLMRASRNHLRAFASRLGEQGKAYTAQHLNQKDFDKIAASPWERGHGRSR